MDNSLELQPSVTSTSNVISFPTDIPDMDKRALLAIERFIGTPPENSRVYWITPQMAGYLIDKYNLSNRPRKPAKIGIYGKAMTGNEWRLTGDTIKFSDRQILRDGQNRLIACRDSGARFQTHIVFGVPDEFFSVMDQGKNRDGSDLLAIEGVTNPSVVAAGVRWAHLYETNTVKMRTTIPAPEVLRLFQERYSSITEFVPTARAVYATHKWPGGFVAGSLYFLSKIDRRAADDFGKAMANSNFSGRYLPLKLMDSKLAGIASVSSGRVNDIVRAALMITAWNLVRTGKKGKQTDFLWDISKPFPEAV